MVTYNRLELTRQAVEALLAKTRGDYALHIVDNASSDGTWDYLQGLAARHARLSCVRLRRNMGVAVAANYGWAALEADYYVKLDNDVLVEDPDWLERLVGLAQRNPEVGMVGHLCGSWPYAIEDIRLSGGDLFGKSDMCNGGCALVPRRVHRALGFWNEDYAPYGFEDLDYCARLRLAGLMCGYAQPQGAVRHMGYAPGNVNRSIEEAKGANLRSKGRAERLFVLNCFMYDRRLRELKVGRKYLPGGGNEPRFGINPDYRALIRLQEELLQKLEYTADENGVTLNLAALTQAQDKLGGSQPR